MAGTIGCVYWQESVRAKYHGYVEESLDKSDGLYLLFALVLRVFLARLIFDITIASKV